MSSQGNHQINEKRLQNGWHFALCWQGCSLEKLWLLSCRGRGKMREDENAGYSLVRDSRKEESRQQVSEKL